MAKPKELYHGTKAENVESILENGIKAVFPAVYMTDDVAVAKRFGEVVLVVKTASLDPDLLGTYHEMLCDILNTTDFWHYYGDIPADDLIVLDCTHKYRRGYIEDGNVGGFSHFITYCTGCGYRYQEHEL